MRLIEDETPGTTSKGMPAAASASASSPPRPKTNGSPHLSRTIALATPRRLHEQALDGPLGHARLPRALPHVEAVRPRCELQHLAVGERVIENEVGLGQPLRRRGG